MPVIQIGGTGYPSFSSVADADAYLAADVVRAAPWALRQPDAKARGLITATRVFQRLGVKSDPEATDIPAGLVDATAMFANDVLAKPKLAQDASGNSNVKQAKAGSASVEFFGATKNAPPLPLDIWALLTSAAVFGTAAPSTIDTPFVSGALGDCDRWPYGGIFWDDDERRGWPVGGW